MSCERRKPLAKGVAAFRAYATWVMPSFRIVCIMRAIFNSQGRLNMVVSRLVVDFARFVAENRQGAKTVSDLLAEVDSERDEDNWTAEQLDLVEDEIIVLPIRTQIAELTE